MKCPSVIVALIVGICLIISAALVSSAIKEVGRSFTVYPPSSMPGTLKINLRNENGTVPLKLEVREP
jgi:hypothetical protein